MSGPRRAVVQKVVLDGAHGPYAVALSDDQEELNITFSLGSRVWRGEEYPEPGTFVMLSQLSYKRAGWRAGRGRCMRPSDQQTATSKEQ